jgi:hypothetical protein
MNGEEGDWNSCLNEEMERGIYTEEKNKIK